MANTKSHSVAVRLPLHLYRWLEDHVGAGKDYPNMNQAVIGELTRAKLNREWHDSLSPRARSTDNNPCPQNDHICPQGEKQCLQA
jgi:Arc/MetJ-type ribon-helix-helix transcriptional regulator